MDTLQIVADMHDSEISAEIAWLYDGVWAAKLGDPINGYLAEATASSLAEAAIWLRTEAVRRYPDSVFAKRYGALSDTHRS